MTQSNQKTSSTAKPPALIAYHVREREVREHEDSKGKGFWTRIGAAWPHKDGKGFNLQIDIVPLDGRIVLRPEPEPKESDSIQ
jgi:hypothetical protein